MADLCSAVTKCLSKEPEAAAPPAPVTAPQATAAPTAPAPTEAAAAPAALPTALKETAVLPTVSEDEVVEDAGTQPAAAATGGNDPVDLPSVPEIDVMKPEVALQWLGVVSKQKNVTLGAACCMRVRVLCREFAQREKCEKHGASRIIIGALDAMGNDPNVCLQGLAGLVNLCSGDGAAPRNTAVQNGAIVAAANAVKAFGDYVEIAEMACLVVQNLCYGEDPGAITRRETAHKDGAIEAVLTVIEKHSSREIMDTCVAALRLTVDRMPHLREIALEKGAQQEWVKPITKEGGGSLLSFRGGFGTSRRKAKASAVKSSGGGS